MSALALLLGLLLLGGCSDNPAAPLGTDDPPPGEDPQPGPPRVLVVNTLSETLSSLDLESGAMNVQAAVVGSWANRIAVRPGGDDYLVTASGDNEVQVLSAHTLALRARIDVGIGSSPWIAIPISRNEAIVSDWLAGDLRRIDLTENSAGEPLPVTRGPEGLAVAAGRAYVACTNYRSDGTYDEGRLDVVDLERWRVLESLPVGRNPQEVFVAADGRIHVLCTGTYGTGPEPEEGSVYVVAPDDLSVTQTIPLGGSPGSAALASDGTVWVAGFTGGVRRYDSVSLEVLPDPSAPQLHASGFSSVDVDPQTGTVYVTNFDSDLLISVDASSLEIASVWLVGDGPVDVLVFRPAPTGASRTARASS